MEPKLTRHFFFLRHYPLFSHFHPQNQIQDEGGEEQGEKQVTKSCWKSFGSSVGFLNHAWVERYKLRLTRHHQGRRLFYFNQQARPSVLLVSVLSQGLSTHDIPQPWPPGQMPCHQKSSPYCSIFPKPCFFTWHTFSGYLFSPQRAIFMIPRGMFFCFPYFPSLLYFQSLKLEQPHCRQPVNISWISKWAKWVSERFLVIVSYKTLVVMSYFVIKTTLRREESLGELSL